MADAGEPHARHSLQQKRAIGLRLVRVAQRREHQLRALGCALGMKLGDRTEHAAGAELEEDLIRVAQQLADTGAKLDRLVACAPPSTRARSPVRA